MRVQPETTTSSDRAVVVETPSDSERAASTHPPTVELRLDRVSNEFLDLIPRDFARQHLLLSQGQVDGVERLAVAQATNRAAIFNTGVRLGRRIETFIADGEHLAHVIDQAYSEHAPPEGSGGSPAESEQQSQTADDIDALLQRADRDLLSTQGKGQLVKLVDALLFEALSRRASDVHIQPTDERLLVRYRLDGVLHTVRELTRELAAPVISRIKVMGRMDIAERRVPQDGRATVNIGSRAIDLRLSTLPTSYGERAVIRLLDHAQQLADFDALGMPPDVAQPYLQCAQRSNGIVLVTGPTGSGKTTTLYATLRRIGIPGAGVNIMTIEDPIEYDISASGLIISQSQVNPRKGVTFATGLRHILRQDPDVVMVGEIRDIDTARIAIQSSLTGHVVFSTLHTNDAASAITRLVDLGVEPYLVSASLNAVLAQRLVRRLHQPCNGNGCDKCLQTGFRGRIGLFELLVVNENIRGLIARDAPVQQLRETARAAGMRTLHEQANRLVEQRRTSELEAQRVVQELT